MGVIAAGSQVKTVSALVEHEPCDHRHNKDDHLKRIYICKHCSHDRDIRKYRNSKSCRYAELKFVGRLVEHALVYLFRQERGQRHGKDVDDHTADDLICLELDTEQGMEQGIYHSADHREQECQIKDYLGICSLCPRCQYDKEGSHESSESLKTFNGKVGNAAPLTVDPADRHDEQRQCKRKSINDYS